MSAPIIEVTEGRVSITANDTEANIREAAGFSEPAESTPTATPETPEAETKPAEPAAAKADDAERNPDGTFKAKAEGDPRKSYQAKINQAIAKQREAERRAEEAERRAQEREAEVQALRQPPTAPQPVTAATAAPTARYLDDVKRYQALPDAPKFDDFVAAGVEDAYTMHQAAMAAFIADTRHAEREAQRAQEAEQHARQSHLDTSFALAAQTHPDFESLLAADTRTYPPAVTEHLKVEAALDPSLSAELFHHLLTHPDDADRLATMTHPIAAAREIGRLTARLTSATPGPELAQAHTNAKPLIKPVRPSVMAPESSPPDALPFGPKYIAAMNELERKQREARRA